MVVDIVNKGEREINIGEEGMCIIFLNIRENSIVIANW